MKLIGKLKICKILLFLILLTTVVVASFLMQNIFRQAVALNGEIPLNITSFEGANRQANKCLFDEDDKYLGNYIFDAKNNDGKNQTMKFRVESFEFDATKTFGLWIFIPSTLVLNNLQISFKNSATPSKSIDWKFNGNSSAEILYTKTLASLIYDYEGGYSKGWKFLNLTISDADKNDGLTAINEIYVNYGFSSVDLSDDGAFSVGTFVLHDKTILKSKITNRQNYVFYKEKDIFKDALNSVYKGDEISFLKTDIFDYVVVGKQNILENESGYTWNVVVTNPKSFTKSYSFANKVNLPFEERGYYLIDINLSSSSEISNLVANASFNVYAQSLSAGYFQKDSYDIKLNSPCIIEFYLNDDFEIKGEIEATVGDKNIANATYYNEGNKIIFEVDSLAKGNTNLKLSFSAKRLSNNQTIEFENETQINIYDNKVLGFSKILIIIIIALFAVALVYLLILFVKSRKFDVK